MKTTAKTLSTIEAVYTSAHSINEWDRLADAATAEIQNNTEDRDGIEAWADAHFDASVTVAKKLAGLGVDCRSGGSQGNTLVTIGDHEVFLDHENDAHAAGYTEIMGRFEEALA